MATTEIERAPVQDNRLALIQRAAQLMGRATAGESITRLIDVEVVGTLARYSETTTVTEDWTAPIVCEDGDTMRMLRVRETLRTERCMPALFRQLLPPIEPQVVDDFYSIRTYKQDNTPAERVHEPWPDKPDTEAPFAEALDAFEAALPTEN